MLVSSDNSKKVCSENNQDLQSEFKVRDDYIAQELILFKRTLENNPAVEHFRKHTNNYL